MSMESSSERLRVNLTEVARNTKSKIEGTLNKLRKVDGGFAEKPVDFQSGAKANLKFIKEHVSGDLEEFGTCMALAGKGYPVVNFTSGNKLGRIFSPEPFIRLNNQKLELIKPDFDFSEGESDLPKILEDAEAVEKLWDKGGGSKKAVINFGKLSREEVTLKVLKVIEPFAKVK